MGDVPNYAGACSVLLCPITPTFLHGARCCISIHYKNISIHALKTNQSLSRRCTHADNSRHPACASTLPPAATLHHSRTMMVRMVGLVLPTHSATAQSAQNEKREGMMPTHVWGYRCKLPTGTRTMLLLPLQPME